MSNTFFVHLPSNSPEYGDNAPNKFRVRLPKPIYFNGSWVCGLHSINYAYSWPSTVGTLDDQWINIHYTDATDGLSKYVSIPVSKASHTSVENFRDFIKATLAVQSATMEEIGKSDYQFIAAERDVASPPRRNKRNLPQEEEILKSPPLADDISPPRASTPPPAKKPSPPKKTEPTPSPPPKKPEPKQSHPPPPPPPPLPPKKVEPSKPPPPPPSPKNITTTAPTPSQPPKKPEQRAEEKKATVQTKQVKEEQKQSEVKKQPPAALALASSSKPIEKAAPQKGVQTKSVDKKIAIILGEENRELRSSTNLAQLKEIVNSIELQYHPEFARFKAVFKHPAVSFLSFSPQLGYVLGFENVDRVRNNEIAKYGCDLRGGFSSFAVYTGRGLTENMIIGNSLSSLLRVVSVSGVKPGEYTERIFDSPIFVRVLPKEVSEIEIELRTLDQGRLVPFAFGTVMVVLVFKKVINF